jgi:hypothetical protein
MGSWKYRYDNLNRVTSGMASGGPYPGYSDCFAYDPWGNRTGEAFSTTACGSSPAPTTWANYNANNRITGTGLMPAGYTYDAAGNVLNDGVNQYLYDNEERICAVFDPTSGAMTGYIYDANGDRVAKGALTAFNCNMASNGFSLTTTSCTMTCSALLNWRRTAARTSHGRPATSHLGETSSVSGTTTQNLRFPGQYFDVESGWNHRSSSKNRAERPTMTIYVCFGQRVVALVLIQVQTLREFKIAYGTASALPDQSGLMNLPIADA